MNKNVIVISVVVGIVAAVAIAVMGMTLTGQVGKRPTPGTPAPDFEMALYPGYRADLPERVKLADLRGKVVVLNFWASWCIPCRDEAPILENAHQEYKDRGVIFLGVGYLDVESAAIQFMQEFNVSYANGADLQQRISKLYRTTGVPETFVIDRRGVVQKVWVQPLSSPRQLSEVLDPLIAQSPNQTTP